MNYNQVEKAITEGIGIMVVDDKPTLIAMLQRNGSMVSDVSSEREILDATFKAIKENKRFRQDLTNYFVIQAKEAAPIDGDANFANQDGKKKTGAGSFLSTLFSKENTEKIIGLGMDYASTRLTAKANQQSNQQAINYKVAEAEAFAQQARAEQAKRLAGGGKKNTWILPVAIIGGVVVIGLVIFLVVRKK